MFLPTLMIILIATSYICKAFGQAKSWTCQQYLTSILNKKLTSSGRRPIQHPLRNKTDTSVILITILLACDIELNPGPRQRSIFPCGMCERPVTWENDGVCCDCCDIWHHKSRIELCTADYELLQRSTVLWLCCKCDSINVSSFTYHTYELGNDISYYESLTSPASFTESFTSKFSPLTNSSPKPLKAKETQESSMNRSNSRNKLQTTISQKRETLEYLQ